MAPIRLGIIGLSADKSAWATSAHVAPVTSAPLSSQYALKAIGTSRPETAKAAAKAYGLPEDKAYSSPEAIASDPEIDMVVVSVKTPLHKELATPALKAGKMVFVEWPLANGLAEAEELAKLARSQNVKTVVGLQARQSAVILKAKGIIDSGGLGRILNTSLVASSSMLYEVSAKNAYCNDPKTGANWTTIPVAHILDPLCFLLGEFKYLNATSAIINPELKITGSDGRDTEVVTRNNADSVSVIGVLESGATVSSTINTTTPATPDSFYWLIAGEKGSLRFDGSTGFIAMSAPTLSQFSPGQDAKWKEIEVPKSAHFGGIAEVYQAFAEGNSTALVDFDEAVKRHKMVDAIFRSSESGERVSYQ